MQKDNLEIIYPSVLKMSLDATFCWLLIAYLVEAGFKV